MTLVDLIRKYAGADSITCKLDHEEEKAHQSIPSLPELVTDWPDEWRKALDERASIMEFDGELTRDVAQAEAQIRIRDEFQRREMARLSKQSKAIE
jgi:glycerophosphoryl diester phosphodiesterase